MRSRTSAAILVSLITVSGLGHSFAFAKDPKGDTGGKYGIDIKNIGARDKTVPAKEGSGKVFYRVLTYNRWKLSDLNSDSSLKIRIDVSGGKRPERTIKVFRRTNHSEVRAVALDRGQRTAFRVKMKRPNLRTLVLRVSEDFINGEYTFGGWTTWWAQTAWISHRGEGICYWAGCFDKSEKKRLYVW